MNILSIVDQVNRGSKNSSSGKVKFEPHMAQNTNVSQSEPAEQDIRDAVETLNNSVADHVPRVSFSYNDKLKRVIVKVYDNETNEVVKEIPAKHVIKLQESIQEYLGVLFDKSI